MKNLEKKIKNNQMITGGHFMIKDGKAQLNEGTIQSFRYTVELYQKGKELGYNVGLGLLVNDIGATCHQNSCDISNRGYNKEDFELPKEYKSILSEFNVNEDELNIYWEKNIRNRAKKLLDKVKSTLEVEELWGNLIWKDEETCQRIVLFRSPDNGKKGTAACPMIMAAYGMKQESEGFEHSLNIYYIGSDNTENVPNYHVFQKGRRIAELLGSQITIEDIVFD